MRMGYGNETDLLFKVSPFLFIHKDQVKIVSATELLVNVPHGGCKVIPSEEQANGNGLTCGMEPGLMQSWCIANYHLP